MIHNESCKVLSHFALSSDIYQMVVHSEHIATKAQPGHFLHIKVSAGYDPLLRRPISVHNVHGNHLSFIYKIVGKGTHMMTRIQKGDILDIVGPLGTPFDITLNANTHYIVGGGVGIPPLVFLAHILKQNHKKIAVFLGGRTQDDLIDRRYFEDIADYLYLATEDGSAGHKGFVTQPLSDILAREKEVSPAIYACGPHAMLQAVSDLMRSYKTENAALSLENRMGCGVGVCLGCIVNTSRGKERVCSEGPVFSASDILWEKEHRPPHKEKKYTQTVSLAVDIAGLSFKNPVITASGTFGYGLSYNDIFDVNALGGITVKGVSPEAWEGNENIRIIETPAGMINAIGLQNKGVDDFTKNILPKIQNIAPHIIVNVCGKTVDEYVTVTEKLTQKKDISALEINISCPNVKEGCIAFGTDPHAAAHVVSAIRKATSLPLIVKLSPNVGSVVDIALAVEDAGADAISLINTILAMDIDIHAQCPSLANIMGGLSGPAIRPIALRMIWEVFASPCTLPLIGMGGIMCAEDAIAFMLAGASLVACGTGTFVHPTLPIETIAGIETYMKEYGFQTVKEMVGVAHQN